MAQTSSTQSGGGLTSLFANRKEVDSYWGTHLNTGGTPSRTSYSPASYRKTVTPKQRNQSGQPRLMPKAPSTYFGSAKDRETYDLPSRSPSRMPSAGFGTIFSDLLGGKGGAQVGYKTAKEIATDRIKEVVNIPTSPVITEDGGASVLSGFKDMAAGIFGMIGAGGDEETVVTPVSYGATDEAGGILGDPVVLGALVLGAGVVVYMMVKK